MKSINVLLVEDNEGDIFIAQEAIAKMGSVKKITIARDGAEAINLLDSTLKTGIPILPDIILMDINLPKKSGLDVLTFIKNCDRLKHIPVIILSTSSNNIDVVNAYKCHANCFITKPYDINAYFKMMISIENFWFSTARLMCMQ